MKMPARVTVETYVCENVCVCACVCACARARARACVCVRVERERERERERESGSERETEREREGFRKPRQRSLAESVKPYARARACVWKTKVFSAGLVYALHIRMFVIIIIITCTTHMCVCFYHNSGVCLFVSHVCVCVCVCVCVYEPRCVAWE